MKNFLTITIILALSGFCLGQAPNKKPLSRYSSLWTDSPFTTKPIVESKTEQVDALADWMLAGVSSVQDGYFVTLMDKRDRNKRVRLAPGLSNSSGIQLVSVKMGDSFRDTAVKLRVGGQVGELKFDTAALKAIARPKPQARNNNRNNRNNPRVQNNNRARPNQQNGQQPPIPIPGLNQNNNNQNQTTRQRVRRPRPRIVPARKR